MHDRRPKAHQRRELDDKVSESERRYREIYESAPNAYITVDVSNGSLLEFNQAFVNLLGFSREEIPRKKIFEFYADTPHGKPKAKEVFETISAGESVSGVELQMICSRGWPIWVSVSIDPVKDSEGKVVEARGIVVDISEQKRAQAALEASEQRFRDIAEVASDWFWETGPDHRYTYVSEKAGHVPNVETASLIGRRLVGAVLDSTTRRWKQHIADIEAHCPFKNFEERYRDHEGNVRTVQISGMPIFDSEGCFQGYRGTSIDITELMRTEAELQKSKGRLAEMLAIAPDVIIAVDSHQIIRVFNEGAENVFGYEASEIIGRALDTLIPKQSRRAHGEHFASFARAPESSRLMTLRGEIKGLRKDGSEFPAEASISKFETDAEPVYTILLHDISDRKRMEHDLVQAKEQAEVASRSKSEFLANMSHELRTPLNAIIGFSDAMLHELHGPIGSEKYTGYARDIFDAGGHLLAVINDLLDLSKIEAGRFDLSEDDVNLYELVDSCFSFVKGRASDRGVQLENRISSKLPALRADERTIKQVFANLLSNAVKFSGHGGRVSVNAAIDAIGRLFVSVEDTGVGIPEEDFDKVLAPFEQAENAFVQSEGTGLGLPLAKSFVELHGAKFVLRSKVGKGTIITMIFPAGRVVARNADARKSEHTA